MHWCCLEGQELVDRLNSECGFVVGGTGEAERACDEGGLAGLRVADEADLYLHHLLGGGNGELLRLVEHSNFNDYINDRRER